MFITNIQILQLQVPLRSTCLQSLLKI